MGIVKILREKIHYTWILIMMGTCQLIHCTLSGYVGIGNVGKVYTSCLNSDINSF